MRAWLDDDVAEQIDLDFERSLVVSSARIHGSAAEVRGPRNVRVDDQRMTESNPRLVSHARGDASATPA